MQNYVHHAIPKMPAPRWSEIADIPIRDNGERLVPLCLVPERILVYPAYFIDGVPGAMPNCLARESVLERLVCAAKKLPTGLRLVVLDAWRPHSVQQYLFETLRHVLQECLPNIAEQTLQHRVREFVSPPSMNPASPSPHITGGSVDVTLCDDHGRLLPMGSDFDEVTKYSYTHHLETTNVDDCSTRANRRLLFHVMTEAGFTNLPSEWWHFDYGNQLWAWIRDKSHATHGLIEADTTTSRWINDLHHHSCTMASSTGQ